MLIFFSNECQNSIVFLCCFYAGENSFQVKIEADGSDITEHPYNGKPVTESRS